MIDAQSQAQIERQIVQDGRSFLHYVVEAFPYTPSQAEATRARIEELAREEQEAVARLIRFLHRRHVSPPVLGSFPSSFTTTNFVSLDHLLPVLEKDLTLRIGELERSLTSVPDTEAQTLLQEHLEMKRRHLQAVHSIAHAETGIAAVEASAETAAH